MSAKDAPKDEWTLSKREPVFPGQFIILAFHKVQVLDVLRNTPDYTVVKVQVLGPVPGSAGYSGKGGIANALPVPPLKWKGELYDTEGVFTPQSMS
jgi:hypothetical protein